MNDIESDEVKEALKNGTITILCAAMFHCTCCAVPISGEMQAIAHIKGSKHLKKVRQNQQSQGQESPSLQLQTKKLCQRLGSDKPNLKIEEVAFNQNNGFFCKICNIGLNSKLQYDTHLIGKNHAKKQKALNNGNSSSTSSSRSPTPITEINVSSRSNPSDSSASNVPLISDSERDEDSSVIPLIDFNNKLKFYSEEDVFRDNLIVVEEDEPLPDFFQN